MSSGSAINGSTPEARVARLVDLLSNRKLEGLLVASGPNRRYLSGFTGSSASLLITREGRVLITDGRYTTQSRAQSPQFEVVTHTGAMLDQVAATVRKLGLNRLGFDPALTTVADHKRLAGMLDGAVELIEAPGLVENLRSIKDEAELDALRKAIKLADDVMGVAQQMVRPGVREIDVAIKIEQQFRLRGAAGPSFPVIVASGRNAAMPHHSPTEKVIEAGESVVVDMGALVDGYCSDMTRTFCAGSQSEKFREIYSVVLGAQRAGVEAARAGVSGRDCDAAARDVIVRAGYGESFGHGTGHGVGLEIHEAPRVSRTSEDILMAGMVHSVEPGIYLPEWGGVRIEDLVLVKAGEAEVLTQFEK